MVASAIRNGVPASNDRNGSAMSRACVAREKMRW
jgi:hypothetical protein